MSSTELKSQKVLKRSGKRNPGSVAVTRANPKESASRITATRMFALDQERAAPRSNSINAEFLRAGPLERVKIIRVGVPAILAETTSKEIGFSKEKFYTMLRFPRATVNRKIAAKERLSPELSERYLGLQKLIDQVGVMVSESGDSEGFDAPQWIGQWLDRPCPALGNVKPVDYMDTLEGQEVVSGVLAKMQSGAYA